MLFACECKITFMENCNVEIIILKNKKTLYMVYGCDGVKIFACVYDQLQSIDKKIWNSIRKHRKKNMQNA